MSKAIELPERGYAYAPGVFQYSAGVGALAGHEIVRARFSRVVPMAEGFGLIAEHLAQVGRPLAAFCACEMRSPAPFDEPGFAAFNRVYAGTLTDWGVMQGETNPVARANVCPELDPPAAPGFHAFCYTIPQPGIPKPGAAKIGGAGTFVIAGSGEAPEGRGNYRDHVIRLDETGPEALAEKAAWVLGEMERRMAYFGAGWAETTGAQLYTVYDVHHLMPEFVRRGVLSHGLTTHFNRPPVVGLDFEMDCRRVFREIVIAV